MQMESPQPFGKYLLQECVAVGGMAEIFRAKTVGSDGREKEIAIKRILPSYSEDDGFVTMFKDEATIAMQLDHPNIVKVYDFGQVQTEHFIAMEFISGADLKRLIESAEKNNKRFTPTQVAFILGETAKALDYAHKRTAPDGSPLNIVHRDVTPHNIMVTFAGDVKLMDFGIAKAASRATKTRAGTVKGKCSYMSPEQARGKPLDGRSDMFSLGIIGWELLTGKRLFTGTSDFDILSKVLKSEIQSPRALDSSVPEELARIVLRMLDRDRDRRYADCGQLLGDLNQFFFQAADSGNHRLAYWAQCLSSKDGHIPGELPNYTSSTEEEEDPNQEKTQLLNIEEMEAKLGLEDNSTDDSVQNAAKTIPLDGNQVAAFLEQRNLLQPQNPNQPPDMMQPGMMQPGMMQPGMMQPGMMQPGMMQPGMMQPDMMQQGMMQQGMMQQGMMGPYGQMGYPGMPGMPGYPAPPPPKSNTGLVVAIVLVLLLILAGGAGSYYYITYIAPAQSAAEAAKIEEPAVSDAPSSFVTIKSSPSGAKVTINGEAHPNLTPIFGYQAHISDKLVIVFDLEGYEPLTIERTLIQQSQTIEETLVALNKPAPLVAKVDPPTTNPTPDPNAQPTDPNAQPTDPNAQPTDPNAQPTDPNAQPSDPNAKPDDPTAKPDDPVAAGQTGSLKIESEPKGSKVKIDGKSIDGTTPLTVADLALDKEMEIIISPADKEYTRVVKSKYKLTQTGETVLTVKHKKAEDSGTTSTGGTAQISVSATPWGQVYLDGERLGNTPVKKDVAAGKHKLEIAFPPKRKRVEKSIKLKDGDKASYGYDFTTETWR